MSENKPTPELGDRDRKRCPVCGEPSYSAAGVHPQCSVKQADAERSQKLKESRLAGKANQAENKSNGSVSLAEGVPKLQGVSACPQKTLRMRPSVRDEVAGMRKRRQAASMACLLVLASVGALGRLGAAVVNTPG